MIINKKKVEYILKAEKEKEGATVFILRGLTGRDFLEIRDEIDITNYKKEIGKDIYLTVKHGLVGWKNLKDDEGKDVEFNPENLDYLDIGAFIELSHEINNLSSVTDTEKKT